jgi:hypothetical protein
MAGKQSTKKRLSWRHLTAFNNQLAFATYRRQPIAAARRGVRGCSPERVRSTLRTSLDNEKRFFRGEATTPRTVMTCFRSSPRQLVLHADMEMTWPT